MLSNGSVGVWCKPRPHRANARFEAHVNFWHISGDRGFKPTDNHPKRDFLEIGILLSSPSAIETVGIFLPIDVADEALADCSPHFAKPGIAEGIFNEVLSVATPAAGGPRYTELRLGDGTPFMRVFHFNTVDGRIAHDEITLTTRDDGTLIIISPDALAVAAQFEDENVPQYFRLRFYMNSSNPFIKSIPPSDWYLHSGYHELEYVDFRFNEARTLPTWVENQMRQEWARDRAPLTLIAFLTAIPRQSQLSTLNAPSYKMRLLEDPTWKSYVPGEIPSGMMVYHWKRAVAENPEKDWQVTEIADFTTFVRLETRHSAGFNQLLFLLFAFLIGAGGSALAGWLFPPDISAPPSRSICDMQTVASETEQQREGALRLRGTCQEQR